MEREEKEGVKGSKKPWGRGEGRVLLASNPHLSLRTGVNSFSLSHLLSLSV